MAKRLAQPVGRRKRSHQVYRDENRIPLTRETAEIIAEQKKLFREQFGREPGSNDPFFSSHVSSFPNLLAMSPLAKFGRVCCKLQAILG